MTPPDAWSQLHAHYEKQDWIEKPSLFADEVITHLPASGRLLDLGAGQGQDSRLFALHGLDVVSTDLSEEALKKSAERTPDDLKNHMSWQHVDLSEPLTFPDASFDAVYAHMSLHYFDDATLARIFLDIHRILRPGGTVMLLLNTVEDPEYGTGEPAGPDLFHIGGVTKRYFTANTLQPFVSSFDTMLLDNEGETYKDREKGIHHLVRFVGRKPR